MAGNFEFLNLLLCKKKYVYFNLTIFLRHKWYKIWMSVQESCVILVNLEGTFNSVILFDSGRVVAFCYLAFPRIIFNSFQTLQDLRLHVILTRNIPLF